MIGLDGKSRPTIAVVGAGIGGLATALALLRRGFDVRVYEQAPALGEVGAGVQISANGARVLFELGLKRQVMATAVVPSAKLIRLWNTGQTWKGFDVGPVSETLYGAPYLTLHRHDLHQALADGVRAARSDAIVLGRTCVGLDQDERGVAIRFEDGSEARADLVVGADGVHSAVRKALFGADEARFTGVVAWRGVIPAERLEPRLMAQASVTWIGHGAHAVHYPLRGGSLMNYVSVVERDDWRVESWSVQGTVEECLADYPGWHPDVHALIRATGRPYKWALLGREPMSAWSLGRVTLMGDACHPMLPFLAQGAAMALEDALVLARCLEAWPGDHAEAFARYERARLERASAVVRGAAANQARYHDPRLAEAAGAQDYVERVWAEDQVKVRYEWMFAYDALTAEI